MIALLAASAPLHASETDDRIESSARQSYVFKTYLQSAAVKVSSKDGVITLRGEATREAQRELITEYVKDIEGIEGVRNEMTVAAKEPEQTLQEKIDAASITAQVKMALMSHRSTSGLKTSVSTKDSIVTLSGKAQNSAEKDLATKLVNDIYGVNSVINNMSIA